MCYTILCKTYDLVEGRLGPGRNAHVATVVFVTEIVAQYLARAVKNLFAK